MLSVCYHSKSLGLHADSSEDETFHAIIVANSNYEGRTVDTKQCIKDREKLRMALLKTGWKCGMFFTEIFLSLNYLKFSCQSRSSGHET